MSEAADDAGPGPDGRNRDPWAGLRRFTSARIGLGRAGNGLPTQDVLDFALAHAKARDAVHAELDVPALETALNATGYRPVHVASAVPDRATYLSRPDLGRTLSEASRTILAGLRHGAAADLAIVVADGLSAPALAHAAPLLAALQPWIVAEGWTLASLVIATQARVALGDEIADALGARSVLVLIGERPGLSAPDSLGAYLTFAPRPGRRDAERNCLSNIRPAGLSYSLAAFRLAWLIAAAHRGGLTGVGLKDDSDALLIGGVVPEPGRPIVVEPAAIAAP